jgi:hypothetical protein
VRGRNSGEFSHAYLQSSIRASLPGRAEGHFLGELGSAHVSKPTYHTPECLELSANMVIAGISRATKHALRVPFRIYVSTLKNRSKV